jgi:DNA repair protein RecN (Recombination protein N)
MLKHLRISNYALIDELEVEIGPGMTVITGETGAGKSIIMGALSLLLGSRADHNAIIDSSKKCIVEGTFVINELTNKDFFTTHEIDFHSDTIIRREINPEGRGRIFINDTPVKLHVLKTFTSTLIDIHSQHENLTLKNSAFRLQVVDTFHGNQKTINHYKNLYSEFLELKLKIESLIEQQGNIKRDEDYFRFLFDELENASLDAINQKTLETKLETLSNSADIISTLTEIEQALINGDTNITSKLNYLHQRISGIEKHHNDLKELSSRLKSTTIELQDIAESAGLLSETFVLSPEEESRMRTSLDLLYALYQKHRVNSVEELKELRNTLDEKLNTIGTVDQELIETEKKFSDCKKNLSKVAKELSSVRMKAIPAIEKEINKLLKYVGMHQANLTLELTSSGEMDFQPTGIDKVTFLFSPNKGIEARELDRIASGGELSRLMLCIKSVLANTKGLATLIFDEIDAGISGEVASKVGNIMHEISKGRQVLVISHLPQMAGKGDSHFLVYKQENGGKVSTRLKKLSQKERIAEIATMLSGDKPSKSAINTARDLLEV